MVQRGRVYTFLPFGFSELSQPARSPPSLVAVRARVMGSLITTIPGFLNKREHGHESARAEFVDAQPEGRNMRAEQVFAATKTICNRFLLCRVASATTHRLQLTGNSFTETINKSFGQIASRWQGPAGIGSPTEPALPSHLLGQAAGAVSTLPIFGHVSSHEALIPLDPSSL